MINDLTQARKLIKQCQETQNPYLDLGNCGINDLDELPELFECRHLVTLILSNRWMDYEQNKWIDSHNQGTSNRLKALPEKILQLENLSILYAGGDYKRWNLGDISFLQKLNSLQSLNLSYNNISDFSFLQKLNSLQLLDLSFTNNISDISFLQKLNRLQSLNLRQNIISDISPLQKLNNLQSLDLSYNDNITDFSPLHKLKSLQSLKLNRNRIKDFSFLQKLTRLQSLVIISNNISDISFLQKLICLQSLNLNTNNISDISSLQKLISLQSLNLSHNKISDISPLENLNSLESLALNSNNISNFSSLQKLNSLKSLTISSNNISDISFLQKLNSLQSLNLSYNQISDISSLQKLNTLQSLDLSKNNISDISFLQKLNSLQSLNLSGNQISDISFLEKLNSLQSLNLSGNQISDISSLQKLNTLQSLDLSKNNISDISFLEKLNSLQSLNLSGNQIVNLDALKELIALPKLEELYLYGVKENNLNIPPDQFGFDEDVNCLINLRNYFASIQKGATISREVPIILIGNSTAGKTSLLELICNQIFPPKEDHSTHGIEPKVWKPESLSLERLGFNNESGHIQFYFWDFGGQEYYHATHRLFFSQQAIYLLIWEQKTNVQGVKKINIRLKNSDNNIVETQIPIALFPYTYWLKSVRAYAPDKNSAPIFLLQNKLDEPANEKKEYPGDLIREQYGIQEVFHLSLKEAFDTQPSGATYRRYEDFLIHLLSTANEHITQYARQTYWEEVKILIHRRRDENIWTKAEFLSALQTIDEDIQESSLSSYTIDLHALGFIFHYTDDEYLKDYIFINPEWVMKQIYAILDDTVLAQHGKFAYQKVVQRIGEQQAHTFLALMKKFELIFEDNEEKVYIAPQYLPETCQDTKTLLAYQAIIPEEASLIVYFEDFMPPSLIQRLIAEFGDKAIGKVYWKYGVLFLLENQHVFIQSNTEEQKQYISIKDHDQAALWSVFNVLREKTNHDNQLYLSRDNGKNYVKIADIEEQNRLGNQTAKTLAGGSCSINDYIGLLSTEKPQSKAPMKDQKKVLKVFISYAHDDDPYFQVFVKGLTDHLYNSPDYEFNAFDDRQLLLGSDWDKKLEKEVEACDVGILLLSPAFINSSYIKTKELGAMLEKLKHEQNFLLAPIYFISFDFNANESLKQYQFFKPDGSKYGHADKGTDLCFADLVELNFANGQFIPTPNNNRNRYLLDLSRELSRALKEKF